jgi:hypothetical protein
MYRWMEEIDRYRWRLTYLPQRPPTEKSILRLRESGWRGLDRIAAAGTSDHRVARAEYSERGIVVYWGSSDIVLDPGLCHRNGEGLEGSEEARLIITCCVD